MSFKFYDDIDKNKLVFAWLNSQNGVSNKTIMKLLEYFGEPMEIWDNLSSERDNLNFIRSKYIDGLLEKKQDYKEKLIDRLNEEHVTLTTILDDDYPDKLKYIDNPPHILYCKGNINILNDISIAIVGSRKATDYGKWCADKFSKELSKLGVVIISGLAYGIDAIAHRGALSTKGKTIGVIGCGINKVYPQKNLQLYNTIEENGGAVISEYAFDCEPVAGNFPARNRIISGLSSGVLVIEAQDKSGTLITAGHAAEQGKDVFAIPGNINSIFSIGTNKLIRDGAKLVTNVDDIIEEVIELRNKVGNNKKNIDISNLNDVEKLIITLLQQQERELDELASLLDCTIGEIISNLTLLEMRGMITYITPTKIMLAI